MENICMRLSLLSTSVTQPGDWTAVLQLLLGFLHPRSIPWVGGWRDVGAKLPQSIFWIPGGCPSSPSPRQQAQPWPSGSFPL